MSETLIRMPKLADTLVEGTLGQWLKRVGDTVRQGEPLAAIETDKVSTELTSPAAGTLLEVLVSDGQTVPIETPIARIGQPAATHEASQGVAKASHGAEAPSRGAEQPSHGAEQASHGHEEASRAGGAASHGAEAASRRHEEPSRRDEIASGPMDEPRVGEGWPPPRKVTPVAARLMAEHGLTPEDIQTTSARLTKADVLTFIAREPPVVVATPRPGDNLVPLTSMRRAIAEHMLKARQTIPHGQSVMDVDLTRLVAWREAHKDAFRDQEGASLTFTVLFVHSLARRLAAHTGGPADVGVAVALDAGLIVPVLRHAEALSLGETARGIADLAARARANKLAPDEIQGARMTLTNVGSFGNLTASPIVPLGQIAILGPGLVGRRPLPAADGGIRLGWRCLLSLMFDRRAFDDYVADAFLRGVIDELTGLPDAVSV
jgi:pyruvate/2-oxoglutarate dehydrogenase complex dihydrolipoamide acyltransferase (E2) component